MNAARRAWLVALMAAWPWQPSSAQVDAWRFDSTRLRVGRLLEYGKSNRDGSRPGRVSIYIAAADRIESLKWEPGDTTAGFVIATVDWARFSVASFESWKLARDRAPQLQATLTTDTAAGGVRVSLAPGRLLPLQGWPWHSYDFDFASLNIMFPFLRQPERPFSFRRGDILREPDGPPFGDLGAVHVRYRGREERRTHRTRRYTLSGPGLEGHTGTMWVALDDPLIVEFEFPFPDEPGYVDGRLVLAGIREMSAAEWERYRRACVGAGEMELSLRTYLEQVAGDLQRRGPLAWLDHFERTPGFFMASDGQLLFPDNGTADRFVRELAGRIRGVRLRWREMRVDSLGAGLAQVNTMFDEEIVDSAGAVTRFAGYLTAIASRDREVWRLRNLHWSLATDSTGRH